MSSVRSLRAVLGLAALVSALLATLPVEATAATDVTQVAAGYESACVLRADRGVSCWGINEYAQTGDGSHDTSPRLVPVRVTRVGGQLLTGAKRLTAGGRHYCTLQQDTTVRCWGENDNGQTGVGHDDPVFRAVTVKLGGVPLTGVTDITAGWQHTCALLSNHRVRCWGSNYQYSLGDGTDDQRLTPVLVKKAGGGTLTNVIAIAAGGYHTCALLADRTMRCWGANLDGELGDGSGQNQSRAVVVKTTGGAALSGVRAIAAGGETSCAIRGDTRALWCWGDNDNDQIGDGTSKDRPFPTRVKRGSGFLTSVSRIGSDYGHTCAISGGAAWCWGENSIGDVGDGTQDPRLKPVRVRSGAAALFPSPVTWIDGSDGGSCLIRAKRAWCWGQNNAGQAGTGETSTPVLYPSKVSIP